MKGAERFSYIVGSCFGRFIVRWFNAFPRFVIPGVFGDKRKLSKLAHQHYIKPFPTRASRQGMWVLAKAIIGESDWLASLWEKRARLADKPVLILSGLSDPTFGPEKLARWQEAFPNHTTLIWQDVGHFVPEELGTEAVAPVAAFLEGGI